MKGRREAGRGREGLSKTDTPKISAWLLVLSRTGESLCSVNAIPMPFLKQPVRSDLAPPLALFQVQSIEQLLGSFWQFSFLF